MEEKSSNIVQDVINYAVRGAIVVLGALILFNFFEIQTNDQVTFRVIGALMILFGFYRLYSYYVASNSYRKKE